MRTAPSRSVSLSLVLAAGCASAPRSAGPDAPDPLVHVTATGARWRAPEGWRVDDASQVAVDPQGEVRLVVLEPGTHDAAAGAQAAARALGVALVVEGAPVRSPPSEGWDAAESVALVGAGELRGRADVRRWGGVDRVVLAAGTAAALARREAQIDAVVRSVAPEGMRPESFAERVPRRLDTAALDAFVEDARARLGVVGAAVAVVQGGAVVYERAVGVRAIGGDAPVTPDTLFLMASVTKPMTTFMQAALVDRGVLTWETPVTALLPDFALADAGLTAQLRLWHMSCACTGMPRRDLEYLFEYAAVTPELRVASMRAMAPTTGLGETFQYSNLMVAAGGFAAAHALHPERPLAEAYARAMQALVFGPIGMTRTTVDPAAVRAGEHAEPHALDLDGRTRALPLAMEENVGPIAPAGAVWSTLRDMERYALTELARGVAPGGVRVASSAALAERWRARIGDAEAAYGLGLDVERRDGLTAVGHDGGALGFGTSLLLFPELDLGLVVLTNVRHGTATDQLPFNSAVKRRVLELLFEGARDVASAIVDAAIAARIAARGAGEGVERTPDPAWLAQISGRYAHPTLGAVEVRGAVFDAGEWQVHFGRRREGTTDVLVVLDPPFAGTPLLLEGDGRAIVLPDPQIRYALERVP